MGCNAFSQPGTPPFTADSVPDHVAFRLFSAAVAEDGSPTPTEIARQEIRLRPIRLNEDDKAVLVTALVDFKRDMSRAQGKVVRIVKTIFRVQ